MPLEKSNVVGVEVRWLYKKGQWPVRGEPSENLRDMNHTAWAVRDASRMCDVIHINNSLGLPYSRFVDNPFVYTIHHPYEEFLDDFYSYYPDVQYVAISDFQRRQVKMPCVETIHHGIDLSLYRFRREKKQYLSFLGRLTPVKGAHLAIAAAKQAGIPLKIAGEIQPLFRDYFESEIKPHIDGKFIEYVGEADLKAKNKLLGNSLAMLFPIQWDEPFGLVMIEAMGCGTPVLALPGGSVAEVVSDGISGYICHSVEELAQRAREIESSVRPATVRRYVEEYFSLERMVADYAQLYSSILGVRVPAVIQQPFQEERSVA